ncbi:hypothetical protein J5N97_013424 [Dioscorea zingiberensis]|uniref:non-specific serine/threonine protein kinase n=1 Tax=Dioscorea zingiberensis TaxID=325984 RepID=A0A9D5CTA6_9LILI|nr:hypothetical protein J5N97_013424 [Dioscorea zingiberensis]
MGNSCLRLRPSKCAAASSPPTKSHENPLLVSSTDSSKITSTVGAVCSFPPFPGVVLPTFSLKSFTLNDLKRASKNFCSEYLLGEGEFGRVFKGWIDKDTFAPRRPGTGIAVAIKKLKRESFHGHKEWLAEVTYLAQLHHENLVKLIGYCLEGDERLLVYEYMQKGSLDNHLFRGGVQHIPWATRVNIAIDVARGISFLHSLEIQEFNAKLSDFGLARNGPTGDMTHVSTRVVGTCGCGAPEYIATGRLTTKSDVYSFGLLLLDMFSGRRAEEILLRCENLSLIDKHKMFRIMNTIQEERAAQVIVKLTLLCLQVNPKKRPDMAHVLSTLEQLQTN